jgi:multidrug efflux pump subunit AcrB
MNEYPGFLFVNSDLYNHTPNLQVDILRDQAKLYGVSETRILTLLHDAYSQNYSYLIKKPTDQYQVILEVSDNERSGPEDLEQALHQERRRPAHGSAERGHELASGDRTAGRQPHQSIHQRDHVLQPEARATPSARHAVCGDGEADSAAGVQGALQGEALTFRNTVSDLAILMLAPCSSCT